MSDLWCKTCGAFMLYPDRHVCPPTWDVWRFDEEYGEQTRDDARHIYANSAESAAEKWAAHDDARGDYTIVGGSSARLCVAKPGDDKIIVLLVEGHTVPQYTASEVSEKNIRAVRSWNKRRPIGTTVEFTFKRYDPDLKESASVTDRGATTGKARLGEYGPVVRVNKTPWEVKLKDVKVLGKKKGADTDGK